MPNYRCNRCFDTGLLVCGVCNGKGKDLLGFVCNNCKGSGHTNQPCGCGAGKRSSRKQKR